MISFKDVALKAVGMTVLASLLMLLTRLAREGQWGTLGDMAIFATVFFTLYLGGTWFVVMRRRRLPGPRA